MDGWCWNDWADMGEFGEGAGGLSEWVGGGGIEGSGLWKGLGNMGGRV